MVSAVLLCLALLFPGTAEAGARDLPQPRLVLDAAEYPWSAIARLNFAGRGFCTAFLVARDLAFTAAHCLYDPVSGRARVLSDLHIVAGYQRDRYLAHARVTAVEVRAGAPQIGDPTDAAMEADLAILRLDSPIGLKTGWLPVRMLRAEMIDRLLAGESRLLLAGYSRRRQHAMELHAPCAALGTARSSRLLVHDCVMEEGASGAPLLLADAEGVSVIGLGSALATLEGGARRTVSVTTRSLLNENQEPSSGDLSRDLDWPQPGGLPEGDGSAHPHPADTLERLARRGDGHGEAAVREVCDSATVTDGLLRCLAKAVMALP